MPHVPEQLEAVVAVGVVHESRVSVEVSQIVGLVAAVVAEVVARCAVMVCEELGVWEGELTEPTLVTGVGGLGD